MKIIIDDKIPYLKGVLEPFAEVLYLPGAATTPELVRDADALITRTRTLCDERLLEGSTVKYIASATIGADHIDAEYCKKRRIAWSNAPGCNAGGVCQYVAAALFAYVQKNHLQLRDLTIGIVGVGHVGEKVASVCHAIGMKVLLNDPPRQRTEGTEAFTALDRIQKHSDIISFHVPLSSAGEFATWHMVDDGFIKGLGKKPLLINSCRGEVFDTAAVRSALAFGGLSGAVIDCWEDEPEIDLQLLEKADIGTPHIAGYSRDGKANGTMMSVRAVSRFFKLGIDDWEPTGERLQERTNIQLDGRDKDQESVLAEAVLATYDILADDCCLRAAPGSFEHLRDHYPLRREFHNYLIEARNIDKTAMSVLAKIGFRISNGQT
jgi:erythronate-4-phosphate dehydrogenase